MSKYNNSYPEASHQAVFERYPWAANHNEAISWLTSYMEGNAESIIKRFDDRILRKVARDHFISI